MSSSDAAGRFVDRFADFWKNPSPERLSELLHPDVLLTQPLSAPMRGLKAAEDEFRRIWQWLPDLRADVDRWSGADELVFIEFRLHAHAGRKLIEWPNLDRFFLQGDKAIARMNYFDPLAVLRQLPPSPAVWLRWWRSGTARPWRSGHRIEDFPVATNHRAEP